MAKNSNNPDSRNVKVDVHYLTRVEGHGNIVVDVKNGKLTKCEFQVIESPRFFESMLVGRSIWEAQHITSRICGKFRQTKSSGNNLLKLRLLR